MRTKSDYLGEDNECGLVAYFREHGYRAERVGGHDDGGIDVKVWDHNNNNNIIIIQSKSSVDGAMVHIARGILYKHLIPVIVGDPLSTTADHVISAINVDGFS